MAITSYKLISAASAATLASLVADEIADGNSPVGAPSALLVKEYPTKWSIVQAIAVGVATVTGYEVVQADTQADLAAAVTTAIGSGFALLGGVMVLQPPGTVVRGHEKYAQALLKGTPADAGYGGAAGGGPIAISDVTGLQTALNGKVATTVTVNGHALSGNVVVSASDLTTGTVPIAQLPVATSSAKGIVQIGSGLTVTAGTVTNP